jgi:hypothetical protein
MEAAEPKTRFRQQQVVGRAPLHTIWRRCPGLAAQLTASSKKGLNAHQLHRMLGTNCKTAWFLFRRLRETSKDVACSGLLGDSRTVEADETHVDGEETNKHAHKRGKVGGGKGGNLAEYPLKGVHLVTDEIEDPRSILLALFEAYPGERDTPKGVGHAF